MGRWKKGSFVGYTENEAAWDTLIKLYRDLLNKNETYESEPLCLEV